ncbi:unnamed protein product [Peronospora farinosa]|uniref:Alanyl-transfer RNA synthetases family profile domain-containing protein n=1 Tax=Peronospora farinosa TaxID=134698 RepID=A0ABN8CJH0_9STRA|nr:unnamed protein product [Peronospora farinosa]
MLFAGGYGDTRMFQLCSFLLMTPNLPSRHTWTASSVLVVPYTTRNATHLLQRALKAELGEHVTQTGLQVTSNRLRFDFAHIGALTVEEMGSVEARVNKYAAAELVVTTIEKKPSEAAPCASFGDKYGDIVRIVRVGYDDVAEDATAGVSVSSKFCGGTYVHNAREVFPFVFSQFAPGSVPAEHVLQEMVHRVVIEDYYLDTKD